MYKSLQPTRETQDYCTIGSIPGSIPTIQLIANAYLLGNICLSETVNQPNSTRTRCVRSSLGYLNYSDRSRLLLIGLHMEVEVAEAVIS